jgi:hypothetical protein
MALDADGGGKKVRVEEAARFPVTPSDGFAYITDPANWPEYWPGLVRIDPESQWRRPGDRATLVLRMLGREVELEMTLLTIEPDRLVEYTSRQAGLPDARHWRHFGEIDGELDYRVVVEYEPRRGWRGLFDRLALRRATARALRETIANLRRRLVAV